MPIITVLNLTNQCLDPKHFRLSTVFLNNIFWLWRDRMLLHTNKSIFFPILSLSYLICPFVSYNSRFKMLDSVMLLINWLLSGANKLSVDLLPTKARERPLLSQFSDRSLELTHPAMIKRCKSLSLPLTHTDSQTAVNTESPRLEGRMETRDFGVISHI